MHGLRISSHSGKSGHYLTVPLKVSLEASLKKPSSTHLEAISEGMSDREGFIGLSTKT